jgi:threonine dehydrogenase-like Zn-dependent dehydrogenase
VRQLTFVKPGLVEWHEVAAPGIKSAVAAIVRPLVVGRCDLDVAFIRGLAPIASGSPIGHEMIGEVVDVGDAVRTIYPGQQVIVPAQINCGVCNACRRGHTGRCQTVPFAASYGMGRADHTEQYGCLVADLVSVPFADAMLVPLPRGVDPIKMISVADVAPNSWRAVAPALSKRPGSTVLVMGGGVPVIGILAAGIAVAMGASLVDYADEDLERCSAAKSFGADIIHLPDNDVTRTYDIVIDACGTDLKIVECLKFTRPEGETVCVAMNANQFVQLPLLEMFIKGVTIRTGRANCRAHMEGILGLCCSGRFDPSILETHSYHFDQAPEAWLSPVMRSIAHVGFGPFAKS